jgi:hypothetical protein
LQHLDLVGQHLDFGMQRLPQRFWLGLHFSRAAVASSPAVVNLKSVASPPPTTPVSTVRRELSVRVIASNRVASISVLLCHTS